MLNNKFQIIKNLEINPDNYDLNLKLGLIYINENNYAKAKIVFKKIISLNNTRYEGFLNLSNIYSAQNKIRNAEEILKKYIKKKYNKEIISALAILYYNSKNYIKLKFIVNKYIDKNENHILFFLKAVLYENENDITNQILFLKKTINLNKNFWPGYEKLLTILERTNKIDEFEDLVTNSKKIFKNDLKVNYYFILFLYRKNKFEDVLKIIESKELENKFMELNNTNYLINLYDLLSKVQLKLKNFKISLDYAIKRNSLSLKKESNKSFDKNVLLDIIKKYTFYYSNFEKKTNLNKNGLFHDNLVFLLGFPRSGTTLLDNILRSHSKTFVLEEKPYLINIRHNFFKHNTLEKIANISEEKIIKLQNEYFNSFNYSEKKITIDKFPLNLIELGFIKKIFPRSKIILALRHPLDSILSCVLTSFKINEAMANYENLQTSAYFYNEVFNLFKIYENSLQLNYHKIKYENVINAFDEEIKNLLSFLNLDFEDEVKNFHITAKNRIKISTPSYHQVVQPIYKNSLNRFKNFPETNDIKNLINKWIVEFDY